MESAEGIAIEYPAVTVFAQVADFEDDFNLSGSPGSHLVVSFGSRIGNFTATEGLHEELRRAGLDPTRTWTDPASGYSVTLATVPADRVCR